MTDAYKRLSQAHSLGFYNCCEMTTAFLFHKKEKKAYNFFTIFVLEERVNVKMVKTYLTPSLISVNSQFSMGVTRSVISLEEAEKCYRKLRETMGQSAVDIGDGKLSIGTMEEVPPVFVQKNSTVEIRLNEVLKNNFKNGSYLLEFFDSEKPICRLLKKSEMKKSCDILYRIVPVNLFTISDRIGNVIFQFPSLNTRISYHADETEQYLTYHVQLDRRLSGDTAFQLTSEVIDDNTTVGFGTMTVRAPETEMKLYLGDTSKICRTTLMDSEMQLIISRQETSYIRHMEMRMHIGSQFGKERILYREDGEILESIDISSAETIRNGLPDRQNRGEWIENRRYRLRMEEIEGRKEFLRYGLPNGAGRKEAISDLRQLMCRGDGHKVYLWDPYLNAKDILETWYYTTTYGMKLNAITSRADLDKNDANVKQTMEDWILEQRCILQKGSNQYGINLELRCQWGTYGYPFHDRFLMIVDDKEKPQVWSLGASVNSIGKHHHIIQKVLHPQMIVEAFEELWNALSAEECLVWKRDPREYF